MEISHQLNYFRTSKSISAKFRIWSIRTEFTDLSQKKRPQQIPRKNAFRFTRKTHERSHICLHTVPVRCPHPTFRRPHLPPNPYPAAQILHPFSIFPSSGHPKFSPSVPMVHSDRSAGPAARRTASPRGQGNPAAATAEGPTTRRRGCGTPSRLGARKWASTVTSEREVAKFVLVELAALAAGSSSGARAMSTPRQEVAEFVFSVLGSVSVLSDALLNCIFGFRSIELFGSTTRRIC